MSVNQQKPEGISPLDRKIITATQKGLPLVARPFDEIAKAVGSTPGIVQARFNHMLGTGIIRRIGVVPNHYRIGYRANGMSVWDIADDEVDEIGELVGALDYVTHCYRRPRNLPDWPYNLFAMVHGRAREEVEEKVSAIAIIIGQFNRGHDILYSTKILKKTGLRLCSPEAK